LTAGPVRVQVATPWTRLAAAPRIGDLRPTIAWAPYDGLAVTVSALLVPADHAGAALASVAAAIRTDLPAPEDEVVSGLHLRAYRHMSLAGRVLDLHTLPTTRGLLVLACTAPPDGTQPLGGCLTGVEGLGVAGARPLAPTVDLAVRARAAGVVAALGVRETAGRAALHAARRAGRQAAAASRLAGAHAAAAAPLEPFAKASPQAAALIRALHGTAAAYRSLAQAARRHSRRGWTRAAAGVEAAERVLRLRIAAIG
jgi:hypothetical protein